MVKNTVNYIVNNTVIYIAYIGRPSTDQDSINEGHTDAVMTIC